MKKKTALAAFGALSQETRLDIFRRLIRAYPEALPAGTLAADLDIPASTLSTHLAILSRAQLVTAERQGRSILYAADTEGAAALLGYLIRDCCGGRPELCATLLEAARPACC
jgi:DNA-binding transcriptional ArsR family regulator